MLEIASWLNRKDDQKTLYVRKVDTQEGAGDPQEAPKNLIGR
jgi:hypothetical protein